MPTSIINNTGGLSWPSPFVGPLDHTLQVTVDISGLTTNEVDVRGYLKPAVPLTSAGLLVTAGFVYGVTNEAVKLPLATIPPTNASLATETNDCQVSVGTIGQINRDVAEDILGRAYTTAELAGFNAAGSKLVLTTT